MRVALRKEMIENVAKTISLWQQAWLDACSITQIQGRKITLNGTVALIIVIFLIKAMHKIFEARPNQCVLLSLQSSIRKVRIKNVNGEVSS